LLCLVIVFLSNYVAGLAGYEAILLFAVGVLLVLVELIVLPGFVFFGVMGAGMIFASLLWSMADLWPNGTGGVDVEWGSVYVGLQTLVFSMLGALVALVMLWKFIPGGLWAKGLAAAGVSPSPDPLITGGGRNANRSKGLPGIGSIGVTATDLHPGGEVIIDGNRYQATLELGTLQNGKAIQVTGYRTFSILVEPVETPKNL
jgi:membrane-bound serine protease (ClpP class)